MAEKQENKGDFRSDSNFLIGYFEEKEGGLLYRYDAERLWIMPWGENALCFAPRVNVQATLRSTRRYLSPMARIRALSPITPDMSCSKSGSAARSTASSQVLRSTFGQPGMLGSIRVKPSRALW